VSPKPTTQVPAFALEPGVEIKWQGRWRKVHSVKPCPKSEDVSHALRHLTELAEEAETAEDWGAIGRSFYGVQRMCDFFEHAARKERDPTQMLRIECAGRLYGVDVPRDELLTIRASRNQTG
jgi:hypothetical protein